MNHFAEGILGRLQTTLIRAGSAQPVPPDVLVVEQLLRHDEEPVPPTYFLANLLEPTSIAVAINDQSWWLKEAVVPS